LIGPMWHYTPLAKAVVFNTGLVGVLQISMGIVGLYVAKIHQEVSGRPLYVVRTRRVKRASAHEKASPRSKKKPESPADPGL